MFSAFQSAGVWWVGHVDRETQFVACEHQYLTHNNESVTAFNQRSRTGDCHQLFSASWFPAHSLYGSVSSASFPAAAGFRAVNHPQLKLQSDVIKWTQEGHYSSRCALSKSSWNTAARTYTSHTQTFCTVKGGQRNWLCLLLFVTCLPPIGCCYHTLVVGCLSPGTYWLLMAWLLQWLSTLYLGFGVPGLLSRCFKFDCVTHFNSSAVTIVQQTRFYSDNNLSLMPRHYRACRLFLVGSRRLSFSL